MEDLKRIHSLPKISVLDNSSQRMLLVEAPDQELKKLVSSMPDWVVSEEQSISLPDTREKIRSTRNKAP